jgi:hypothetical protein
LILVLGATGAYGDHSDQAAWDGSESNAWSYDNNWSTSNGSPSRPPDDDDRVNIGTDKKILHWPVITGTDAVGGYVYLGESTAAPDRAYLTIETGRKLTVTGLFNVGGGGPGTADVYGQIVCHDLQLNYRQNAEELINIYDGGSVTTTSTNAGHAGGSTSDNPLTVSNTGWLTFFKEPADPGGPAHINLVSGSAVAYFKNPSGGGNRQSALEGFIAAGRFQIGGVTDTNTAHYVINTADGDGGAYTSIMIPEPATVAILGLGSLVLLRRRR